MVGERIKELRIKKGLSLRKLATLSDVALSNLSTIESNKVSPSANTLDKLSVALGVNTSDFFNDDIIDINAKKEVLILDLIRTLVKEGIIKDETNIPIETLELLVRTIQILKGN